MSTYQVTYAPGQPLSESCIKTAVSLLVNIVETACEHESDLELMRLVNFMDLYRTYLAHHLVPVEQGGFADVVSKASGTILDAELGVTQCASFEQFISDSHLLRMAATAASRDCGVAVATPPPLKLSANTNIE